jgi:hypothetical protein
MNYRKGQFIGVVNQIHTEFSFAHPECKCKMLKLYGCAFYGSSLWDLYDSGRLYTSWNIAIRTLCNLPYRTHTRFLDKISGLLHIKHMLKCRFVKFIQSIMFGENKHLSYILNACTLGNCLSPSGLTLYRIMDEYKLSTVDLKTPHTTVRNHMHKLYKVKSNNPDEDWVISLILELMDCKLGAGSCGLDHQQVCEMLEIICTD